MFSLWLQKEGTGQGVPSTMCGWIGLVNREQKCDNNNDLWARAASTRLAQPVVPNGPSIRLRMRMWNFTWWSHLISSLITDKQEDKLREEVETLFGYILAIYEEAKVPKSMRF